VCLTVQVVHADTFALPPEGTDLVGHESIVVATQDETLADIARRFDLGHDEIRQANPDVDFWLPGGGTQVVLPTRYILPQAERRGIVLNVPEMRLYYYYPVDESGKATSVITYPVSIGDMNWSTPLGLTKVSAKVKDPSWTPPLSIRHEHEESGDPPLPEVVPPGPENPLGHYAIRLDLPGYLIHGTNRPYGVGMRVTHGCIRMYPEDIERLFSSVTVNTPVQIVDQPVKVGWVEDTLYIEVHPLLEEDRRTDSDVLAMALELIERAEEVRPIQLSVRDLLRVLREHRGVPVPISSRDHAGLSKPPAKQ